VETIGVLDLTPAAGWRTRPSPRSGRSATAS